MTERGALMGTPVVVGREAELDSVRAMLTETMAGSPTVVLLGGDAGVGKTAFASGAMELAGSMGFQLLAGACLSVTAGIPFAPVVEALRPVLGATPERLGASAAMLGQLLPGGGAPDSGLPPGQVLDLLLAALGELASAAPVLLVLEDMHWADASTRELAVHLARNIRGPVCLLLSYRSDDLHRRHPLRPVLSELARSTRAEHVDLGPLDRAGLTELLSNLLGAPADAALVGAVMARSGGNPLFAEELLAARERSAQLPPRLADLLLARIDALSPATVRMLRLASAGGARVDTQLVARVLGESPEDVEAAAREAVDFNVLALRAGFLEFRHELLREAAYDDLLPGERARVHGRLAEAMEVRLDESGTRPTMAEAAQIAYHWGAGNQLPHALNWSLRAGQLAAQLAAPETTAHLDRVLELWDQVPTASEISGVGHAEVLLLAAEAATIDGHFDRARALLDRALEEVDEVQQPLLASRIFGLRGRSCGMSGDGPGRLRAVDRAVELADGVPTVELAGALEARAVRHGFDFMLTSSLETSRRAVDVAVEVGALAEESGARLALSWALLHIGEVDAGLAEGRRAVELARATGREHDAITAEAELAFRLFTAGRPDEAVAVADAAAQRAVSRGLRWTASFCVNQKVESLLWMGQLDAADLGLREMVELERGLSAATRPGTSRMFDGMLRMWRGDLAGAAASFDAVTSDRSRNGDFSVVSQAACWLAQTYALQGRVEALDVAMTVARDAAGREGAFATGFAATTLLGSLWLLGDAVPAAVAEEALALGLATARLAELAPYPGEGTQAAGFLAETRAWTTTAAGAPDPEAWAAAVSAWEAAGFGYPATQARAMLAYALLTTGERDSARAETVRAWTDASAMCADGLAERLGAFARRARFPLQAAAGTPSALDVLTPREREVLALLAEGASNRAIAQTLFISSKTAAVHVSNVLAKLGVGSRLEAAALAHRTGQT
jgi:DNA-binding CsgD family transcriptional regulator/tetratricopeptide (TPR) repeat protein